MLKIDNLHFTIDNIPILKGISARFEPFKIHGLIGPNGSGKTTLLKNICRIWEPQAGTIFLDGRDYRSMSRRELSKTVTLVPQDTSIGFPITVFEIVAMGRNPHLGRFQSLSRADREIIAWAFEQTDTGSLKDRNIKELSGGECQLAIIARALATEASLILLDEPTSDLDIGHTLTIMDLLTHLKGKGKTILVSIHDLNLARRYCDTVSIVQKGRLIFAGSPEEAFSMEHIKSVFGVGVKEVATNGKSYLHFY